MGRLPVWPCGFCFPPFRCLRYPFSLMPQPCVGLFWRSVKHLKWWKFRSASQRWVSTAESLGPEMLHLDTVMPLRACWHGNPWQSGLGWLRVNHVHFLPFPLPFLSFHPAFTPGGCSTISLSPRSLGRGPESIGPFPRAQLRGRADPRRLRAQMTKSLSLSFLL